MFAISLLVDNTVHTNIYKYKYYLVLEFGVHSLDLRGELWNLWNDVYHLVYIWIFRGRRKSIYSFSQIFVSVYDPKKVKNRWSNAFKTPFGSWMTLLQRAQMINC